MDLNLTPSEQQFRDELRAWLAPQLSRGAIELSLVGDLEPDAAKASSSSCRMPAKSL